MARQLPYRAGKGLRMKVFVGVLVALCLTIVLAQEPLTVMYLQKAYEANPLEANHRYRGEMVTVVGKIINIYDVDDGTNEGYLALQGNSRRLNNLSVVTCIFDQAFHLYNLQIGGMAKMRGRIMGDQKYDGGTFTVIWLRECSLIKPYNGPRW